MSIGYSVSALHKIASGIESFSGPMPPELSFLLKDMNIDGAAFRPIPAQSQSAGIADIVAWRDGLAKKYQGQLGEVLTWDESSNVEVSEDVAASADVRLRYVAILVEKGGPQAVRDLLGVNEPERNAIERAFGALERNGSTGQFQQLLMVSSYWLPFQRDIILDAPDWLGEESQMGSTFRLADELKALRAMIAEADPPSTQWTRDREVPESVLGAAWQASDTILHLCTDAMARKLPLWTTG
jgi:hypothetical protein